MDDMVRTVIDIQQGAVLFISAQVFPNDTLNLQLPIEL
jgi:hypothetical protein